MKRSRIFAKIKIFCVLAFIFSLIIPTAKTNAYVDLPSGRERLFTENRLYFYKPNNSLYTDDGCAISLDGKDNLEKIWNYLINLNIPGFSDNAEALAGVIGNFAQESGFNPFSLNSSGCIGIAQWCSGRGNNVKDKLKAAGIDYSSSSIDPLDVDKAIKIELDYMIGEGQWKSFINNLNVVSTGPEGYADLFLLKFEIAHPYGSSSLSDPGVKRLAGSLNDNQWQGASNRRSNARNYYNRLSGEKIKGSGGSTVCVNKDIKIKEGGLSESEAQSIIAQYLAASESELKGYGISKIASCKGDLRFNCSAFSVYFVNKFTSLHAVQRNGKDLVGTIHGAPTGTVPRPYSVFSTSKGGTSAGHTGVILGVNGNNVVVAEASCHGGYARAITRPLSYFSSGYTFAYLEDYMK